MGTYDRSVPDQLPILSRGKHRNPRKGACFMELASYLAGERWSDHPACTHPLLAAVARAVNDSTSDEARSRLAVHIPSVVGLVSDDPRVDVRLALVCARVALPIVAAGRQRALAVGILACERALSELDGRSSDMLEEASRAALERVPHAAQWARRYTDGHRPSFKRFHQHATPSIVSIAVRGIAEACVPNSDQLLHDLLVEAISECARHVPRDVDSAMRTDATHVADGRARVGSADSR